ncbi:MAG: cell division protein ZapA [Spirochaetaceae bacterium]|jgi:cell division protein ZapA (FtsZ GTPase activity inhibitor)|nr:cell division protein ZapA [Spirochaetaceae bacterium]GMO26530.1 MAG: cell division protein ZapA [Termitinemataceae bacterium]
MLKTDFRIDVLGASFSLTVDEDPVYLQTILSRYHTVIENTQKISNFSDPLKIAVLAGIQLCDELEKLRAHELTGDKVVESMNVENTLLSLIERIDSRIPN